MSLKDSDINQGMANKLRRSLRLLIRDQDFRKLPEYKLLSQFKIRSVLNRRSGIVAQNIAPFKQAIEQDLNAIIETVLANPSKYILKYAINIPVTYKSTFDKLPHTIMKYVDKKYVNKDIKDHCLKYGSIGEYRYGHKGDITEADIQRISNLEKSEDKLDLIESRVLKEYFKQEKIDFESIWHKFNNHIESNYFIGCYTEDVCPEYMWREYAHNNGACIEVETDGLRLYKVLYQDYLEQYHILSNEYRRLMGRISTNAFDDLRHVFKEFYERMATLFLLCFYRKNDSGDYPKEGEWREIIPGTKDADVYKTNDGKWDFILVKPPGKFTKVISRMPLEQNEELKKICGNNIKWLIEEPSKLDD